jgi:hypothetical protein
VRWRSRRAFQRKIANVARMTGRPTIKTANETAMLSPVTTTVKARIDAGSAIAW